MLEREEVMKAESPGVKIMFIVKVELKKLPEMERKWFHTNMAKLLYLAK
jgi:hypothetical protein